MSYGSNKMEISIYQADAFTDTLFCGNPAAVCILKKWPPGELMQQIAMENNLAETAFILKENNFYHIRWFTPIVEVDLCGHATLAAAAVIYQFEDHREDVIRFISPRSGELTVTRRGEMISMNFPADNFEQVAITPELIMGLNISPAEAFRGNTDYMFVYTGEDDVAELKPDFTVIKNLKCRGIIVTARGKDTDFVSRFFAPQSGIDEDPVTGSAHTTLIPYWAEQLGKNEMQAIQLSPRKGFITCKNLVDRVEISGKAVIYLAGKIYV